MPQSQDKPKVSEDLIIDDGGHFVVDRNVILRYAADLGPAPLAVYLALKTFANGSGEAYPAQATIAELLGIKRRTVATAISDLEACGLVEVTKRSTRAGRIGNLYRLPRLKRK